MRADLPVGIQAAQIIHAAGQSAPGNLPDGTYAVALTVKNEAELASLCVALTRADIKHELCVESDESYRGQAMAIGVAPMERGRLKPLLSSLPLLK